MEFTVERDGFHGALYRPATDRFPGKALIAFSGSDGSFPLTCKLAEIFQGAGLTTLALAYWNAQGLPKQIAALPVEAVERPALWLRSRGCEKVGLWGISKGGELALLAASLMPELISCVVAVSPMDMVCQAIDPGKKKPLPGSSWSWRGAQLPYAPFDWSPGRVARDTLRARELTLRPAYETAAAHPPEEALIPVERIAGPVLLLTARHDSIWPAAEAAERVVARLDAAAFPHAHRHICYEYASHLLVPVRLRSDRFFAMTRKHPEACARSRADSLQRALDVLEAW